MSIVVKKGFKLIMTHVLSLALTLFLVFVLGWLIKKFGVYAFSIISTLFYIGLFYSEGWNWGRLEGRKYNETKENPLRALTASIIPSIVCIAFATLVATGYQQPIVNVIAKIWYFPFVGFYNSQEFISVVEILLSGAIIPVVVTIGYFVGTKNFSVLEKIAYRKNKKKIQAKKSRNDSN